mgnify:CR=1 FL=1
MKLSSTRVPRQVSFDNVIERAVKKRAIHNQKWRVLNSITKLNKNKKFFRFDRGSRQRQAKRKNRRINFESSSSSSPSTFIANNKSKKASK